MLGLSFSSGGVGKAYIAAASEAECGVRGWPYCSRAEIGLRYIVVGGERLRRSADALSVAGEKGFKSCNRPRTNRRVWLLPRRSTLSTLVRPSAAQPAS